MPSDTSDPTRIGDSERSAVLHRLDSAYAEGRLLPAEHAERSEEAWSARTRGELDRLVADLPLAGGLVPGTAAESRLVAVLGGARRAGRWRPAPSYTAVAVLGGCEIDLREAVVAGGEVTIRALAVCGGISLLVPPGTDVTLGGASVLGARSIQLRHGSDACGLHVRLDAVAVLGGVHVHERPMRKS